MIGGKYIFQYFLPELYDWVILVEPVFCLALKLLEKSIEKSQHEIKMYKSYFFMEYCNLSYI